MKKTLLFLIILIAAVWVGLKISVDPGYVVFYYGEYSAAMTLWTALLAFFIFLVLLWLLFKVVVFLFRLPARFRFWSHEKRQRFSRKRTNLGLIALAEGNWFAAERALLQGAEENPAPLINFLSAAYAAQEQQAYQRRDEYLRKAYKANPNARIAIGLTQAKLQIDHHQREQALATLCHLKEIAPKHRYVLKLLPQVYEQLGEYKQIANLIPLLKKYRIYSEADLFALEQKTAIELFHQFKHYPKASEHLWNHLPKYLRRSPLVVKAYIQYLILYKQYEKAESLLKETLKRSWNNELVLLYSELFDLDTIKLIHTAESWLTHHKNDANLLLILGILCLRKQLYGKARDYLQKSISYQPTVHAYYQLGRVHEQMGDLKLAAEAYKKAAVIQL